MRGSKLEQVEIPSTLTPDELVPADHPIRRIKVIVDRALAELHTEFDAMYSRVGRPSIAPERLLKASLLIALYTVRSERQFCERLQYDMLFKWFLDMNIGDAAFDPTTFSKNRERLLDHEVAHHFFNEVRGEAERRQLLSDDHFTVDGTLLEAWASVKSVRPKDDDSTPPSGRNPAVDFHGHRRRNDTHQSTTDPEARLAKKSNGTAVFNAVEELAQWIGSQHRAIGNQPNSTRSTNGLSPLDSPPQVGSKGGSYRLDAQIR